MRERRRKGKPPPQGSFNNWFFFAWLLLSLWWVEVNVKGAAATSINVLAVNQFSTDTSKGLDWFTGKTKSLAAVFPLAIAHFNNRNGKVIPKFGSLSSCNTTLKLVYYADDEGSPTQAMKQLVFHEGLEPIHAILGPITSSVAGPLSVTASALRIPIVSHWATSPVLANKQNYAYFSRTVPADNSLAVVMGQIFEVMKFKKIGMIYVNNDFGQGWKNALLDACISRDIILTYVGFDDTSGRSLERCKYICDIFENVG
jgi:hypothetical protein